MLHWIGYFCAGMTYFGTSIFAWSCGMVGLYGILSIMVGASSRLERDQEERYGGTREYVEWRGRVRWSLVPFVG